MTDSPAWRSPASGAEAAGHEPARGLDERVREDTHIKALDGLRGLAALTVAISHFSNQTQMFDRLFGRGAGQLGVMLFFALSGYLMGRLYLGQRPDSASLSVYFTRRVARVVPLYLAVVLAAFLIDQPTRFFPVNAQNLLHHLAFIEGQSDLWTIPVEIQFYLLFPVIWAAFRLVGRLAVIPLVAAAVVIALLGYPKPIVLVPCFAYFALGIVISRLRVTRDLSVLFAGILVLYVAAMPQVRISLGGMAVDPWRDPVYIVVIGGLLLATLHSKAADLTLGSRPWVFLGTISYSFYLLHRPVLMAVKPLDIPVGAKMVLFLAAATLVAWLVYVLFERPMRIAIAGRRNHAR